MSQRIAKSLATLLIATLISLLLSGCGGGSSDSQALPVVSTLPAGLIQADNAAVDQLVQTQMLEQRIPGVTLVVVKAGQIVYAKGYGYANLETATPVRPEDRFEIGSITKSFAATAIMLLVQDGKVSLDDKLDRYVGPLPAAWSGITVRHVLSHASGLPEYPDNDFFAAIDRNQSFSDEEMLARFETYPLLFAPGTGYQYSNVGFDIVGLLVNKVSGQSYGDFLQQRVFQPLGMASARIMAPNESPAAYAQGYELGSGAAKSHTYNAAQRNYLAMAASGIEVNALDMAKWDAALYTSSILNQSSLDQMWTPTSLVQAANATTPDIYYGLGWQLRTQNGHRWVYHSGGMPGHVTEFLRFPDDQLTIIALCNLDENHADMRKISLGVARIFQPGL
jgi:D-alanyl-D-alanine carboxypeptidase